MATHAPITGAPAGAPISESAPVSMTIGCEALRRFGYDAGHIASICRLLADGLYLSPSTSLTAEAVEGLGVMARRLSDAILTVVDD